MKVGIITFHRAVNYGAVFQSIALLRQLEKMGCDAHLIDYRSKALEAPYDEKIHMGSLSNLISGILQYSTKKRKKENFYSYITQNGRLDSMENIGTYDVMITGSDQVWNTDITGIDNQYFLEGCPAVKVSYAACTGKDKFAADDLERIKKLLKNYRAISVRDEQSRHAVSKVYGGSIIKVLDPTLLLTRNDWESICSEIKLTDYILVFSVGFSERMSLFAVHLAKSLNKKLIFVNSNLRKKGKGIYMDTAAPDEVLSLFKNADYIVTNSFHGTAMSIAFEKDFYVELEHEKKGRNKRVEDMLLEFGIEKREITSDSFQKNHFSEIDWNQVNKLHDRLRKSSIRFLEDILR